jgi:hypothetical protein
VGARAQHRLSGIAAFDIGEFTTAPKRPLDECALRFSKRLGVEPNISLNWIERQGTRR